MVGPHRRLAPSSGEPGCRCRPRTRAGRRRSPGLASPVVASATVGTGPPPSEFRWPRDGSSVATSRRSLARSLRILPANRSPVANRRRSVGSRGNRNRELARPGHASQTGLPSPDRSAVAGPRCVGDTSSARSPSGTVVAPARRTRLSRSGVGNFKYVRLIGVVTHDRRGP